MSYLKENLNMEIKRYDDYIDSREAWLGKVPSDWTMVLLSQLVTPVKNKNIDLKEQNLLSLSYGKIKRKSIDSSGGLLPESFDGYNIIEANDIVLRLTDLQNDHTSLRVGLATERGIITSAYTTLRPKNPKSAKFLYYLIHSFDIRKGFYGMGSGVRQGLNYDEVKKLKLPIPFVGEQEAIADYLDSEIVRIDSIISEAKASIEEYKAWKASIIYEAVTKGLDPNVEMKDSGIDIIGNMPDHWTVCRLKYLCNVMTGNQDTQNADENGAYPFYVRSPIVQHSNMYTYEGEGILMAGDGAGAGRVFHHAFGKYAIHQRVYCFHDFRNINTKYFLYFISELFKKVMDKGSAQSTVPSVRLPMIQDFVFCMPSIDEQSDIVYYLDTKCKKIDEIISEKEVLITDLENYKKSLIFEVVTGKRKVV